MKTPTRVQFFNRRTDRSGRASGMAEFDRLTERGGVLVPWNACTSAIKYRKKVLYYETLKHTGEYPIVGVNTFLNKKGSPTIIPQEVIRSTEEEKQQQINTLQAFKDRHAAQSAEMLQRLQKTAVENGNLFEELMETVKYCSLGQITTALYASRWAI
jgi:methylmalonyl-CoA mutase